MNKVKFIAQLLTIVSIFSCFEVFNIFSYPFKIQSVIAQNQTDFTTYKDPRGFSISYPKNWLIEKRLDDNQLPLSLFNYNYLAKNSVEALNHQTKTDIYISSQAFDEEIKDYLNNTTRVETVSEELIIIKKGFATLGGKRAYRVWLTGSSFAWPDSITTYIENNNKTIVITSFCYRDNLNIVKTIEQIHGSFRFSE